MTMYVVSYKENPEPTEPAFAILDTKYDAGYDWTSYDRLALYTSMFSTAGRAEDYAKKVIRNTFYEKVHVVSIEDGRRVTYIKTISKVG